MIACPKSGCSGYLDEWCCTNCGKVTPLSALLGHMPVTEKVAQVQDDLLDLAERGVT